MLFHFLLLLCKTTAVNDPSEELQTEPLDVFDPAYQEYLDYQSGIVDEKICRPNYFSFIVIFCALFWTIYQLVQMYSDNVAITRIVDKCAANHTHIQRVSSFYGDTENLFSSLESQAKDVKDQYNNVDSRIKQIPDLSKFQEDMKEVEGRWRAEFGFVGGWGNVFDDKPVSNVEIKAEMTMAKGLVDKEVNGIEEHMREDDLQLEDVRQDVSILKNHFGK